MQATPSRSAHLSESLPSVIVRRMLRSIEPVQRQVILLKLVDLMENIPDFPRTGRVAGESPARQWLARASALINKLGVAGQSAKVQTAMGALGTHSVWAVDQIKGLVQDAIEALKLDLELEGRADIGNVYAAGEVYRLFSDLKDIVAATCEEILLVDPYFDGKAFRDYLSTLGSGKTIKILAERYAEDVRAYAARHAAQYGSKIETRRSRELHDRLVIVDNADCWVVGASIKDAAARAATYLLPLQPKLAEAKRDIYSAVWDRAESIR